MSIASVTLLMAIHCHQPVGNFGFVFEEAYAKAYDPFLRVLEHHPDVHLALHYSGPLLDWLADKQPAFLTRVKKLVARSQVELLTSGYYEPILPLIPEADRQGQMAMMHRALKQRFGADADGLWLTERVWEPELPATLARAGIRYTMLDTNQFLSTKPWLPSALQVQDDAFWDLLGSYTTEYTGSSVRLFPSSKRLRYWMPFQSVERTIEFLGRLKRNEPVAITFADDGEKFGFWPKTYHWVYEENWLEQFFAALERESSWLVTSTFRDYVDNHQPDGQVYLPSGSYEEMLEWSGGHFRNFFTKYPEANAMQQTMLRVSETLETVSKSHAKPRTADAKLAVQAKRELYTAQCNCAYWHGVFGGLYLSHLRRAVYQHLIAAERLVNQLQGKRASLVVIDVDGDGADEAHLVTPSMGLVVDPAEGGTIASWHLYRSGVNLLDTLSRRPESYHKILKAKQEQVVVSAGGATPASIHDEIRTKENNLASHLIYDDHRRSGFVDYALQSLPNLQELVQSTWGERRLWSSGAYRWQRVPQAPRSGKGLLTVEMIREIDGGAVSKTVRLWINRPTAECTYRVDGLQIPVVGLEFNVSLRDPQHLTTPQQHGRVSRFEVAEPETGIQLTMALDAPADVMSFPIETVSESEGGLERTYQGLCVACFWTLGGARTWSGRVQWTLRES